MATYHQCTGCFAPMFMFLHLEVLMFIWLLYSTCVRILLWKLWLLELFLPTEVYLYFCEPCAPAEFLSIYTDCSMVHVSPLFFIVFLVIADIFYCLSSYCWYFSNYCWYSFSYCWCSSSDWMFMFPVIVDKNLFLVGIAVFLLLMSSG